MPDNGRFSDREIEHDLRDLGARIEYPPTPDLSQAVRRQIDDEDAGQHTARGRYWPSLLTPRWAATAAALVLIAVAAFSPAVRATLSDIFVSGETSSSGEAASSGHQAEDGEAGGSAARPQSGSSGARSGQEAGVASQAASRAKPTSGENSSGSVVAESARDAACPSLSLEVEPARAAPEAKFRLHGDGFSTVCDGPRPAQNIKIDFRQDGKTWKLATVDADPRLTFEASLHVPAGARSGQATVRATTRSGELVEEHFVVLR
jgi:hypothetical protein